MHGPPVRGDCSDSSDSTCSDLATLSARHGYQRWMMTSMLAFRLLENVNILRIGASGAEGNEAEKNAPSH